MGILYWEIESERERVVVVVVVRSEGQGGAVLVYPILASEAFVGSSRLHGATGIAVERMALLHENELVLRVAGVLYAYLLIGHVLHTSSEFTLNVDSELTT